MADGTLLFLGSSLSLVVGLADRCLETFVELCLPRDSMAAC